MRKQAEDAHAILRNTRYLMDQMQTHPRMVWISRRSTRLPFILIDRGSMIQDPVRLQSASLIAIDCSWYPPTEMLL